MDEKEILKGLKSGQEEPFEELFRQHYTGLCLFAEHFLGNSGQAEEVVEDFFCDLWEKAPALDIRIAIKPYLYKSIYYRCLKYIRHQKSEHKLFGSIKSVSEHEALNDNSGEVPWFPLLLKEMEGRIEQAIAGLPDQCRQVFLLHRYENLSYLEIAEQLQISVNTVKTQMTRALQKLRVELKDYLAILLLLLAGQ